MIQTQPKFKIGDRVTCRNKLKSKGKTRLWHGTVVAVRHDKKCGDYFYSVDFKRSCRPYEYIEDLVSPQMDIEQMCKTFNPFSKKNQTV